MQKQDSCGCLFCVVLFVEEDWTDARPERNGNESRDWRWGGIYPLYVRTVPRSKLIWRDSDRSPGNVPHLNEWMLSGGGGSSRVYLSTTVHNHEHQQQHQLCSGGSESTSGTFWRAILCSSAHRSIHYHFSISSGGHSTHQWNTHSCV